MYKYPAQNIGFCTINAILNGVIWYCCDFVKTVAILCIDQIILWCSCHSLIVFGTRTKTTIQWLQYKPCTARWHGIVCFESITRWGNGSHDKANDTKGKKWLGEYEMISNDETCKVQVPTLHENDVNPLLVLNVKDDDEDNLPLLFKYG
jgi:hypothetical protein